MTNLVNKKWTEMKHIVENNDSINSVAITNQCGSKEGTVGKNKYDGDPSIQKKL